MAKEDDIKLIIEQEKALVFPEFDEDDRVQHRLGDPRSGDCGRATGSSPMCGPGRSRCSTWRCPAATGDNPNWVRRKANLVRIAGQEHLSRRARKEHSRASVFPPRRGLDNMDVVLAGGGFPIRVKGAGLIGAITVSGLHERDDHGWWSRRSATHLGVDKTALSLPPL